MSYFGELLQKAGRSGDTAPLAAVLEDCGACLPLLKDVEHTRQQGGHQEGGALHVVATGQLPLQGGRSRVAVYAAHDASFAVIQSGSATRVISSDPSVWKFQLVWTDNGWRITAINHVTPEVEGALRSAKPGDEVSLG